MTIEQAYERLELPQDANLQAVRERFQQMHNQLLMQIDGVCFSPELKRQKEDHLEELKEAFALITGDNVAFSISGSHTGKTFDSDAPQNLDVDKGPTASTQGIKQENEDEQEQKVRTAERNSWKTADTPAGTPSGMPRARKARKPWILITLLSLALVGGFGYYWFFIRQNGQSLSAARLFLRGYELDQQKRYTEAAALFQVAAPLEEPRAAYLLGEYYTKGEGLHKNIDSAGYWYRIAFKGLQHMSRRKDSIGLVYLGNCNFFGLGTAVNYEEALKAYQKGAEAGYQGCQTGLANMYLYGYGVLKDVAKAAHWYKKAAEGGNVVAQNNLAVMYEYGYGIDKDIQKAMDWYQEAGKGGSGIALDNLGDIYVSGAAGSKDITLAHIWYDRAMELGAAAGYNSMGANILNPEKDPFGAAYWFRKAAAEGNPDGLYNLGRLLEVGGRSVPKDEQEAVRLYRQAAAAGHYKAQIALGVMYEFGKGVTQDVEESKRWYDKAKHNPDSEILMKLERL